MNASQVNGLGALATQNNVNASQVNGLGALATQNNVSTSQVNGLGPLATQTHVTVGWDVRFPDGSTMQVGDFVSRLAKIDSNNISTFMESSAIGSAYIGKAAIKTAHIDNAAITSAKIGYGEIKTAHIDNAAITSAKIGYGEIKTAHIDDLQVDTLKIAGNAVTIPVSAYTAGSTGEGGVQSASIWSTGAPIFVIASYAWQGNANNRGVITRVLRNGVVVYDSGEVVTPHGSGGLNSVSFRDTPGAGHHAYTLQVLTFPYDGSVGGVIYVSARSILLLEVKR